MDCRTIGYIVSVAKAGNFRIAADRCHVSTSTLSIQVKALEQVLGVRLFDRSAHPIRLTPEGQALLPHFEGICEAVRAVRCYSRAQRALPPSTWRARSVREFQMEAAPSATDNAPCQEP